MRPLDRRAIKETLIERVHLRRYYSPFSESTTDDLTVKKSVMWSIMLSINTTMFISIPLKNNYTTIVLYATMTKTQTQAL